MLSPFYEELNSTIDKYKLIDAYSKNDILEAVYTQLCKDISIDISDFGKPTVDVDWLDWMTTVLEKVLERAPEKFFQSLYRIDVPEHFVSGFIKGGKYSIAELALIVLKRELLKVALRFHYK